MEHLTNSLFRDAPDDWRCPVCMRPKSSLHRKTSTGKIQSKLVYHHDHFDEFASSEVMKIFSDDDLSEGRKVKILAQARHVIAFVRAFEQTLICEDCNHTEARAKSVVGAPKHFSFGPVDLRWMRDIGSSSGVNEARLLYLWPKREILLRDREYLFKNYLRKMRDGWAWWEPTPLSDSPGHWRQLYDAMDETPGWSIPGGLLLKKGG